MSRSNIQGGGTAMNAIEVRGLSSRTRGPGSFRDISLAVPYGGRLAVIGGPSTGKSEMVRILMNLDRARSGTAHVLGSRSTDLAGTIFTRIGYVPQNHRVPLYMTVRQFLARWEGLYPTWDYRLETSLSMTLSLPMHVRMGNLERHQRLKAALLGAVVFRPGLLVLDSVFDETPQDVQREVKAALQEALAPGKTTVLMTAREPAEVDGLCDHIAWLIDGTVTVCDRVEALREQYRRITVTFENPPGRHVELPPHWILLDARGRRLHAVDTRFDDGETLRQWRAPWPGAVVDVRQMAMEEIGEALLHRAQPRWRETAA